MLNIRSENAVLAHYLPVTGKSGSKSVGRFGEENFTVAVVGAGVIPVKNIFGDFAPIIEILQVNGIYFAFVQRIGIVAVDGGKNDYQIVGNIDFLFGRVLGLTSLISKGSESYILVA